MLYCSLCDWRHPTDLAFDVFCICPDCFSYNELTEHSVRKVLENLTSTNVNVASPDTLFGSLFSSEPIAVKAKTNGHKNNQTKEVAIQTSEVFDYWREKHDHPDAMLSNERAKVINKHLLGTSGNPKRSAEDLKKALLGYSLEPIEANGKRYDDITLLLRDAKHIEGGIEITNRSQKRKRNLSRVTEGAELYEDIFADIKKRRTNR